jgi:hypothetical protein
MDKEINKIAAIGLQKELDYLFIAKNNLWAASLATFGGSFGLILTNFILPIKLFLFISGLIISALFLDNYFKKDDKIENIIKVLKRG